VSALAGSFLAWSAAFVSTYSLSISTRVRNVKICLEHTIRLNLIAAFTLLFIAFGILRPFPFISVPLSIYFPDLSGVWKTLTETLRIQDLFFILIAVALVPCCIVGTKGRRPVMQEELANSRKSLVLMTWLPPILQVWLFAASTKLLLNPVDSILIGLFVISGPASWQFGMLVMSLSKSVSEGTLHIVSILLGSLVLTVVMTLLGLLIGANLQAIELTGFRYATAFSLMIVPLFFSYSHWGDKWANNRPIAAIMIILFATFVTAFPMADNVVGLVILFGSLLIAFLAPMLFFNDEARQLVVRCPKCVEVIQSVKTREELVSNLPEPRLGLYRGEFTCPNHPHEHVTSESEWYVRRPSIPRYIFLLALAQSFAPQRKDIQITIAPDKQMYSPGDTVTYSLKVNNRKNKTVDLAVRISWEATATVEGKVTNFSLPPENTVTFSLTADVPDMPRPSEPTPRVAAIHEIAVAVSQYYPTEGKLVRFPHYRWTKERKSVELVFT
jgi:hypothetical protein